MASSKQLVIVADDDVRVTEMLCHALRSWGCRTKAAYDKDALLSLLACERPALVLLDLHFGDTNGLELLQQLRGGVSPELQIAVLTGRGTIDHAVAAMRFGASDFLTKPADLRRLQVLVTHALEKFALADRVKELEHLAASSAPWLRLMGESAAMQKTRALIRSVAPTDANILILGESGTGKELAARSVHELSRHKDGPFIALNMAALPRELAESLLFGHEKGAFTGADRAQLCACELAINGTLFLDEIGEMELSLQAKLLRFLQERTIQRVGNPRSVPVNVRVVTATNRDLDERVRAGKFREDFYYRLNVIPVRMPALRDRRDDIPMLVSRFSAQASLRHQRDPVVFSAAAIDLLFRQSWPGNVRQLENLVERLVILSNGPVIEENAVQDEFGESQADLPIETATPKLQPMHDGLRLIDQVERRAIVEALAKAKGSVKEASQLTGLSLATIYRKLKRYEIDADHFAQAGVCGTVIPI